MGKRLLWNIEAPKPGNRVSVCDAFELETTYAEIVVSTQSTNVGISDGHLTRVAPGTAQERERRRVESERTSRPNQSRGERIGKPVLENCQRWRMCVLPMGRGLAARCSDVPFFPLGGGENDF